MNERERLPDHRRGFTEAFDFDGLRCVATFGFFADGKLAEVFLRAGRPGSAADIACHYFAVTLSIALQHGVPLHTIRHALERLDDGRGAGPLGRALDLLDRPGGCNADRRI